ncbi:lipid II flippase Amj family protein [Desertivirga xinjiangensis]|uniref:lipid II flippase Amj family protein n=1 Tax=Desertivirga xinjiangensis TaxID=539206 RepID=UPI002109F07C|nr:lipid II flippase Amj family protein [Pedobacter xinjiangensis]
MTTAIVIVIILTLVINIITTVSYSVRVVGIRTGKIAISFALFNILVLISRTANGFQAPLLAKMAEDDIKIGILANVGPFRYIILSCTLGTVVGAFLIPSFQRLLSKAVMNFSIYKSIPRLLIHGFSKNGIHYFRESLTIPVKENITQIKINREFPWRIFILNIIAVAILTIGVLSAVYAAYINPDYRTTASNLSAVINGLATILMFMFIDPHLSVMTDDVVDGKCSETTFRRYIIYMVAARLVGTLIAQLAFIPCAELLGFIAGRM